MPRDTLQNPRRDFDSILVINSTENVQYVRKKVDVKTYIQKDNNHVLKNVKHAYKSVSDV